MMVKISQPRKLGLGKRGKSRMEICLDTTHYELPILHFRGKTSCPTCLRKAQKKFYDKYKGTWKWALDNAKLPVREEFRELGEAMLLAKKLRNVSKEMLEKEKEKEKKAQEQIQLTMKEIEDGKGND